MPNDVSDPPHVETRWERVLLVVGIVLLSLNLRPAVTSLGTLLDEVRTGLDMSAPVAGLLTTLPVLCFAVFGSLSPFLARAFGIHRVIFTALMLMVTGLVWRADADSVPVFLVASALALSGMAMGNVLLPPLVKRHFPHRISLVTALYSAGLMVGAAAPSFVSVPLTQAAGSWRWGLLAWGVVAAVTMLPWLALLRHDVKGDVEAHPHIAWRVVVRSRMAWAMAGFFGLQSSLAYSQFGWLPQVYRDAGLPPDTAALMLGALTLIGVPVPLLLPLFTAHYPHQGPVVVTLSTCSLCGFVGLLLAPATAPWLWAVLLGIGGGAFPWLLTMLGLRTATPEGTVVLSGFVQSVGYLLAAAGSLLTGLLYDATGGWTVPLLVLAAVPLPMLALGLVFARPRYLEDELATDRSAIGRRRTRR